MKVLSTAPTRISLFGGGTDVEPFASLYGGIVINMAINIRQKIVMYSDDDLWTVPRHNFPYKANPEFYYKILDEFGINDGLHLTKLKCEFDGLIESGLGSSASAAVALVGASNKRLNLNMTLDEIASKAWDLEVNKLKLFGGKQDQWAAAYGGVNVMEIGKEVRVTPLAKGFIEPLVPSMVLLHTGVTRKSPKIQEELKNLTVYQAQALQDIKALAIESVEPIGRGDIEKVGTLMNTAWDLKKKSNPKVSDPFLNELYAKALTLGAYGGKILGSGGGGYMFFIVSPDIRAKFIEEMGLEHVDFSIDWNGLETRIE